MDKLVKIFLKLLSFLKDHGNNLKKARSKLVLEGNLPSDIDAALEWYFGETITNFKSKTQKENIKSPSKNAFRIFTKEEEMLLSTNVRGYLIELLTNNVITYEEVEEILEFLRYYDLEDVKIEDIDNIMKEFKALNWLGNDNNDEGIEFKIRYIQ